MTEPVLKNDRAAIEASLESAKVAFRAINKPVAIVDQQHKILFVNKTWTRLAAMPEDEYMGRALDTMVHPKDLVSLLQLFTSEEAQGSKLKIRIRTGHDTYDWCPIEVALLEFNGEAFWVLFSTEREFLHLEGVSAEVGLKKITAHLKSTDDLKEGDIDELVLLKSRLDALSQKVAAEKELRIKSEKLAQANALLGQFAWLLAHELKEPVRVIATTTGLLLNDCSDEEDRRELTSYLREAASTAIQKIDDILHYCSINRNQWTLKKVDTSKLVSKVVEEVKSKHKQKKATITATTPLPKLLCHKSSLESIFEQLLSNAILYSGEQAPVIEVSAYENNGDEWVFAVKDNGIGIAEGSHKRVFDMFCRLDRSIPGRGIGLPISKRIAELHDGRMWLESQIGKGSTFYFSISKRVSGVQREEES